MKKIIFVFLLATSISVPVFASSYLDKQLKETSKNIKYESVQKHTAKYSMPQFDTSIELKDPKLITISNIPKVNENDYKAKIAKDDKIYNSKIKTILSKNMQSVNIQPADIDFYNVYRIAERLIRANNLDYVNWRIAIRKSEEDFNASTTSANLIYINTALYDSLYTNQDALAFVIGHEMSHQILGHQQRTAEMSANLNRLKNFSGRSNTLSMTVMKKKYLAELRNMEYISDAMGMELMTRAGFDTDKGMEALTFMNALPNVKTLSDDHPMTDKRIESVMEIRTAIPTAEWVNEGKYNILNSNVLDVKKSSDRVSIIISKDEASKNFYKPEDLKTKLKRIAYASYKNRNMENAVKYFEKLKEKDYIVYLYISYANEYLYNQTHKDKYLTSAKEAIEKAKELAPDDKYVQEQVNALSGQ